MNAKNIKLGFFALAGAAMLASCGAKGTSMTRAEAETELDAIAAKTVEAKKVTYTDGWDGKTTDLANVDVDGLYAYRKFNTKITISSSQEINAGAEVFAYKDGEKYIIALNDGSDKVYGEYDETLVKTAVTTCITAINSYANGTYGQAKGTANWLRGFDKTEEATKKTTLTAEDLNNLPTGCTVKGYVGSESYTKYADGEMTAEIVAMYPYQQSLMDQGGEKCIYEFKNYQLTRLYNNYQKYEEKFDWANAATSAKIDDTYTKIEATGVDGAIKYAALPTAAGLIFGHMAHGWSD